jgi:hypothetical protein
VPILSPGSAAARVASAAYRHPERLPDARRDLYLANLAKLARETVDKAIASGAAMPTEEQRAALAAILAPWMGDAA